MSRIEKEKGKRPLVLLGTFALSGETMTEDSTNVRSCQVESLENVLNVLLPRIERRRNVFLKNANRLKMVVDRFETFLKSLSSADDRATVKTDPRAVLEFGAREIVEGFVLFGLLFVFVVVSFLL